MNGFIYLNRFEYQNTNGTLRGHLFGQPKKWHGAVECDMGTEILQVEVKRNYTQVNWYTFSSISSLRSIKNCFNSEDEMDTAAKLSTILSNSNAASWSNFPC